VNEHKNMILAIVLSAIVLVGWSFASERYFPTANPPVTRIEKGRQVATPQPQASAVPNAPAAMRDRAIVLRESPRVAIRTPRLAGSINLKGARIDDLVLTTQRETIAPNSPPIRLFSPAGAADAYFAGFGWTGQALVVPGPDTVWQASDAALTPAFRAIADAQPEFLCLINNAATAGPVGTIGSLGSGALTSSMAVNLVAPVAVANLLKAGGGTFHRLFPRRRAEMRPRVRGIDQIVGMLRHAIPAHHRLGEALRI